MSKVHLFRDLFRGRSRVFLQKRYCMAELIKQSDYPKRPIGKRALNRRTSSTTGLLCCGSKTLGVWVEQAASQNSKGPGSLRANLWLGDKGETEYVRGHV